jgi:hypothetical protein
MSTEKPAVIMRKVLRVDRSPMNDARWVMTLTCGHEVWAIKMRGFNRDRINGGFIAPKGTYYCEICTKEGKYEH